MRTNWNAPKIKHYYTFEEFSSNYQSDMKEWLSHYPNASEKHFIDAIKTHYDYWIVQGEKSNFNFSKSSYKLYDKKKNKFFSVDIYLLLEELNRALFISHHRDWQIKKSEDLKRILTDKFSFLDAMRKENIFFEFIDIEHIYPFLILHNSFLEIDGYCDDFYLRLIERAFFDYGFTIEKIKEFIINKKKQEKNEGNNNPPKIITSVATGIKVSESVQESQNNETQKEKDNENKRLEGILLREKTYTLPIDFWEETIKTEKYKHTTQTIRSNDFLGVHYNNTYFKIYSEGICYLSLNEVEAIDKYKNEKVKIECSIFYDDYLKGYLEGIEYFNKNHNVSPDTLYGENAKTLVQDLHYNLCHKNHEKNGASFEGWISCKNKYPLTFSNKTFEAYGYYAGILNQLTNLVEQYPVVFDKYNICPFKEEEHDNNSFTFQNNFDHVNSEQIYEYFKEKICDRKYLSELELQQYLKDAFEIRKVSTKYTFQNKPLKKEITAIFYKYYAKIAGKPHRKQERYASLLGDYFTDYKTSTITTNFAKSTY